MSGDATPQLTNDEKAELVSAALDCAFDGNGPPNQDGIRELVALVEELIRRRLEGTK